ncbi:MAG: MBL fold metallo-hydrolase [Candidatus Bathyarchaeota archaeon]|nr:MBL fold metallo-hydrolase [Candidatus Bathyarchaeota archaeon]
MHAKQVGKNVFAVDLQTGGYPNLICSYIVMGNKPFLVESGPTNSIPNLLLGLKELKIQPQDIEYVAVTHVHLDHGGGAGTLLKHLPNAKVLVHPRGAPHLIDPERLWPSSQSVLGYVSEIFGKPEPVPKDLVVPVTEDIINLGGDVKITITETVGHASHHLSFQESVNGGVFPGDAAGTYIPEFDVVVPTTPPPFRLESALATLDKLISLNPTALYYTHFGRATDAIKRLQTYKQQLQLWADIAEDGVAKNQSFEVIRDRIVAEDKVMNRIAEFVKSHPVYSKTMLDNCVLGFVEYTKSKVVRDPSYKL